MLLGRTIFEDVADAVGLNNPAIVEKDYFIVQLLQLVKNIELPHHDIVFSGGTALAGVHQKKANTAFLKLND